MLSGASQARGPTLIVLWLMCQVTLLVSSAQGANSTLPNPLGYVSDYAGVLETSWKARLRSVCQDLERKTGVKMVVVTIPSADPYQSPKAYADALFTHWGIGTAQQQHGVMVLASVNPPQVSVTVGRNMIRVISPTLLQEVSTLYVEPNFQKGKFGEGLYQTVVALAAVSQEIRIGTPIRRHRKGLAVVLTVFSLGVGLWFFWWMARPDKQHPFRRIQRGEFWGTGQGGFGGNFGGFGGGMSGEGWK